MGYTHLGTLCNHKDRVHRENERRKEAPLYGGASCGRVALSFILERMPKVATLLFVVSFLLNYAWEHAHAFLYVHYQGAGITESVLLHATFADALFITLIALPFFFISALQKRTWFIVVCGVVLAISIELWALQTGRWAYSELMPIVPLIGTGLTPTIQLGLLGYLSYRIVKWTNR